MNLYEEYLDFIGTDDTAITDAPAIYHEACFYSLLGTMIGRKRHIAWGIHDLYPNSWTVLLGVSSDMHKSTAINISEYFLRMSGENLVLPNDFTSEALIKNLSEKANGIFIFSEYAHFLANIEREYNFGLRSLITSLYDSPELYQSATITRGNIELHNVCLSMLAASTPQWLRTTEQNMEGGLMTRTFFVYASPEDKKFKQYFPVKYNREKFHNLSEKLNAIKNNPMETAYTMPNNVKELYRETINDIDNITFKAPQIRTLFARANIFLIKYSIIIQTILDPETTEISELAMIGAGIFVKNVISRMIPVFTEIPKSSQDQQIQGVLRIIKREGEVTRSGLLHQSHMLARDLDQVIRTLVESHLIFEQDYAGRGVYYLYYDYAVKKVAEMDKKDE